MTTHDDGGPAFPGEQGHIPDGTWNQTWDPGMSVRQVFAAQALAGLCANEDVRAQASHEEMALEAVRYADALLRVERIVREENRVHEARAGEGGV